MINEYREKITSIDLEIQKLFCQRMEYAKQIGLYKKEHNLPIFDKKREKELLEMLLSIYPDNQTKKYYKRLMKEIFALSKEHQND
ncbi:MAG: chorismate mutase [Acholeplasma sp.]|nr:chorismate mutase [Acholeplasma sp.]